jgi:hypothetical protein
MPFESRRSRHRGFDPEIGEAPDRYRLLLEAVVARQARLVADWLLVSFIHGVMNTDNMSIAGETVFGRAPWTGLIRERSTARSIAAGYASPTSRALSMEPRPAGRGAAAAAR